MRSTFTFNGHSCDEFGIYISKKPNINRSQRKFQSASVAGRNGNIYQLQDAWDEVVVTYDIFAGGYEQGDAPSDFTDIMEWLNSADDYARLEDSYDTEHYRMAVFVDATNIEQKWYSTGQAQIKFRCKPQHFLDIPDVDVNNLRNYYMGEIVSFDGDGQNLDSLTAEIKAVQSGSGDPSPTNVRPISGWDEVNVNVAGKNRLAKASDTELHGITATVADDGTITLNGTTTTVSFIRGVVALDDITAQYSFSAFNPTAIQSSVEFSLREANGNSAGGWNSLNSENKTHVFTPDTGKIPTKWQLQINNGKTFNNYVVKPMLVKGSTPATTYEPYNGQTYTIALDGTRYGGSLDVTTGVLTVTHGYITSYNNETLPSKWISDRDVYASGTTPTIGAEVVYELATPQTVQLTPQEVKTLVGENNIWVDSGEVDVVTAPSIANPTNHVALPIITMKGTGTRSQLSLLGKTMANYELVVGTAQLYGLVSDALNGKVFWVWSYPATSTTRIRYIGGNDSQLNLNNANGQVGATSTDTTRGLGFILPVTPNTEYTISANAISNNSKIKIWYGASGGYNDILGMEETSASGLKIQHTFKAPAECGYILIAFYRTDGTGILFSNVMLSTGSEAKTFKAYSTPVQTDFTIGNVTLSMLSDGFDVAEIDCERENIVIDGTEKNNIASILDPYGNLSVNYLHLDKGENAVAFSGDIDSVVMDPRFWEL